MGFSIHRNGLINIEEIIRNIAQDLLDGGMNLVWSDVPAEQVFVVQKTLDVRVNDEIIPAKNSLGEQVWQLNSNSPNYPDALLSIEFLSGHIPPAGSKITSNFEYLRGYLPVVDVPVLGTVNGINNVFYLSNIQDPWEVDKSTLSISIEDTTLSISDYTVEKVLTTGKVKITIDELSRIPRIPSNITSSYTAYNRGFESALFGASPAYPNKIKEYTLSGSTLTLVVDNTFLNGTQRLPGVPQTLPIYAITPVLAELSSFGVDINGVSTTILCRLTRYSLNYSVISLNDKPCTTIVDKIAKTTTYTLDLSSVTSDTLLELSSWVSASKGETAIHGYSTNLITRASVWGATGWETITLTPQETADAIAQINSNAPLVGVPTFTSSINVDLYKVVVSQLVSGISNGYTDEFYTDKKYSIADPDTFELKSTNTSTSEIRVYTRDVDYTLTTLPTGITKIKFALSSVPNESQVLSSSFKYQIPGTTKVVGCSLKGISDGSNPFFDIGPRLVGKRFTFESSYHTDPLYQTQPWRIHLDSTYVLSFTQEVSRPPLNSGDQWPYTVEIIKEYGRIVLGTEIQLTNDGTVHELMTPALAPEEDYYINIYDSELESFRTAFHHGQDGENPPAPYLDQLESSEAFGSRVRISKYGVSKQVATGSLSPILSELDINNVRTCAYQLSVSDHGIAFHLKSEAAPLGLSARFFCVQRLVNAKSGKVLVDGLSPVMCIASGMARDYTGTRSAIPTKYDNSNTGMKTVWQIVVREKDTLTPSVPKLINKYSDHIAGVWNSHKQVSLAENNSYILTLPDGLVTDRHLYHNERIDMVSFISANVIAESMIAKVNIHGETDSNGVKVMREYTAQRCTIGYQEGSRVMLLTAGGGI